MIQLTTFTNYFNRTRKDKIRRKYLEKREFENITRFWILKRMEHQKGLRKIYYRSKFSRKSFRKLRFFLYKNQTYICPKRQSHVKSKNRCIFTDNARSVNQEFRLARMTFKEVVAGRYITGVTQLPLK